MGRLLLVGRLAARDLRRRPAEAALLLLAIIAATTTLTLGLVLHGVTDKPYQTTREATAGPDVVARPSPAAARDRAASPPTSPASRRWPTLPASSATAGRTRSSGPPWGNGRTVRAQAEGRDPAPATIDQPKLTQGGWVGDGGVVVEAAFADALGVGAGDRITLTDSRKGRGVAAVVPGRRRRGHRRPVAVSGGVLPWPFCPGNAGLVWLTQADVRSLAPRTDPTRTSSNLKLADPAAAPAFVDEHNPPAPGTASRIRPGAPLLQAWQEIRDRAPTW